MEAKFKIGDRVVVSMDCDHALGYSSPAEFLGKAGQITGVFEYFGDISTDYDVVLDDVGPKDNNCPGFEEEWLTLESV